MTMKNFLSIGNKKETFVFNKDMVTLIRGDIGSGKSLLLDALFVLFFGRTYSGKTLSDVVNWYNKKNCELSLLMEDDDNQYVIERGFKPDYARILKNGREVSVTGKDGVTEYILNLLNIDKKVFEQTVFLSEKFFTPYMELGMEEKRNFIKRIFSLEKYDYMKDLVSTDFVKIDKEKIQLETKMQMIESEEQSLKEHFEQEKIELNEKRKQLEQEIGELKKQVSKFNQQKYDKVKELLDKQLKIIDKIESVDMVNMKNKKESKKELLAIYKEEDNKRKNIVQNIEILNKKIAEFPAPKKGTLKEHYIVLKKTITDMAERGKIIQEKYKMLEQKKKIYDENNAEFEEKTKKLIAIQKKYNGDIDVLKTEKQKEIQDKYNEIKRLEATYSSMSMTISDMKKDKQVAQDKKKEIEDNIAYLTNNDVCSQCGSVYKGNKKELHIKELQDKLATIDDSINAIEYDIKKKETEQKECKKEIDLLTKQMNDMEFELKKMIEDLQKITDLNKDIETIRKVILVNSFDENTYEKIKKEFDEIKVKYKEALVEMVKYEELGELFEKMEQLEKDLASSKSYEDSIKELEIEIENINEEIKKLQKKKEEEQKKFDEINKEFEELKEQKENKDSVETNIKAKEELLKEILSKIDEKPESKTIYKNVKERKIAVKSAIEEKNLEYENLTMLLNILGDNGIKKYIISRYLLLINNICNKYLTALQSEFYVVFNNKKGLFVDVMKRGMEVSYKSLSNGQSKKVNLAILFTFIEFLRIKNNSNFPMIFLDEMFDGSLSSEELKIALTEVKKNIPYVNIITHRSENFEMADKMVLATMNGRFTEYKEIGIDNGEKHG